MRKSKREAAATRESILRAASREFRKNGIVATGLTELMQSAGLTTRGGFYKHFESKDQLVAEAAATALDCVVAEMKTNSAESGGGIDALLASYLCERHRDNPQDGCALGAIGSEFARADAHTRDIVTDGFRRMTEVMASQFKGVGKAEARDRALFYISAMIGAITMSRVVSDRELSRKVLQATRHALAHQTI